MEGIKQMSIENKIITLPNLTKPLVYNNYILTNVAPDKYNNLCLDITNFDIVRRPSLGPGEMTMFPPADLPIPTFLLGKFITFYVNHMSYTQCYFNGCDRFAPSNSKGKRFCLNHYYQMRMLYFKYKASKEYGTNPFSNHIRRSLVYNRRLTFANNLHPALRDAEHEHYMNKFRDNPIPLYALACMAKFTKRHQANINCPDNWRGNSIGYAYMNNYYLLSTSELYPDIGLRVPVHAYITSRANQNRLSYNDIIELIGGGIYD